MHDISVFLKDELKGVKVDRKKSRFRQELRNPESNYYLTDFGQEGLPSPLEPKVKLYGVHAEQCTIFRSAI